MTTEQEHLAQANRHISIAERLISEQQSRLEELKEDGFETVEAEKLLVNLKSTLEQMYVHRQLILDEIARGR
jgi:hypothetical protein